MSTATADPTTTKGFIDSAIAHGLPREKVRTIANATPNEWKKLVSVWPGLQDMFAYDVSDVSRALGFEMPVKPKLPVCVPIGGTLIAYYGGWEPQRLLIKDPPGTQPVIAFNHNRPEAGYYRVMPRVPGSDRLRPNEQMALIRSMPGWEPAHLWVAATALCVDVRLRKEDFLLQSITRCEGSLSDWSVPSLEVVDGKVRLSHSPKHPREGVYMAAMQKLD